MSTDIMSVLQKRNERGEWTEVIVEDFLSDTNYALFGWLANVRNYSAVIPLDVPRGLPSDFAYDGTCYDRVGEHDFSWFTIDELLAVNFDQIVENRRTTGINSDGFRDGSMTSAPGDGRLMPLREFLGTSFLDDLKRAKEAGAERIVFGFGS